MKILVKPEDLNNIQAGKYEALCELNGSCVPVICSAVYKSASDEASNTIVF